MQNNCDRTLHSPAPPGVCVGSHLDPVFGIMCPAQVALRSTGADGMSENGSDFKKLLTDLEARRPSAATQVFDRFAARLVALARSHMDRRIRRRVDPEDVTQSVFRSFFERQQAGQFRFEDWGGLWGLLVTMTVRKCGRRADEFYAARRDGRREIPNPASSDNPRAEFAIPDPQPTPDEAAALTEFVDTLLNSLDTRGQQVVTLRLEGYSVTEISKKIGRTQRTVQRILERVKQQVSSVV